MCEHSTTAEEDDGSTAELNDDIQAGGLTINGERFADYAHLTATESAVWSGDEDCPWGGEVRLSVSTAFDIDAELSPADARRVASQLVEAADRAEREAARRNEQRKIVEAADE
jgi:hypothetical protein